MTRPTPIATSLLPDLFKSFAALRRVAVAVQFGALPDEQLTRTLDRHDALMGAFEARIASARRHPRGAVIHRLC
jgi:hypothetical protein